MREKRSTKPGARLCREGQDLPLAEAGALCRAQQQQHAGSRDLSHPCFVSRSFSTSGIATFSSAIGSKHLDIKS